MESVAASGRQLIPGQGRAFSVLVEAWKARVFAKELHEAKLLSDEGWKVLEGATRLTPNP